MRGAGTTRKRLQKGVGITDDTGQGHTSGFTKRWYRGSLRIAPQRASAPVLQHTSRKSSRLDFKVVDGLFLRGHGCVSSLRKQRRMFRHGHLALQSVRLQPGETWVGRLNGLCFLFPNGGRGRYVSTIVTHVLSPGGILILSADVDGSVHADDGGGMTFCFFTARLEHLFPLFAGNEISRLQNLVESLKVAKYHQPSVALAAECKGLLAEASPHSSLVHRGQLLRVVSAILAEQFNAVPSSGTGFVHVEEHMVQVLEKLSAADLTEMSVSELAARFGCSKRQLNRLFHHYFGYSVAAMRMEMRLLKAVSLLRDPDAKIINTAEQCGFHHLGQFNGCFKRRFGTSPSLYRKAMAQVDQSHSHFKSHVPVCPLRAHGFCPGIESPPDVQA